MAIYIEKTAYGRAGWHIDLPLRFQVHKINKNLGQIRAKLDSNGDLLWDALGVDYRGQRLLLTGSPILRLEAGEWLFYCDMSDYVALCTTKSCEAVPF